MALELIKTNKLTIKNLGIFLSSESTQEELSRALVLEPALSSYIVETQTIKTNGTKKSNKENTSSN